MVHNIDGGRAIKIADSIEREVAAGHLSPGTRLPSIRDLAEQLGVNRNTVGAAYKRLAAAGIVVSGGRRGTKISAAPPVAPVNTPAELHGSGQRLDVGGPDPALLPNLADFLSRIDPPPRGYGEQTNLPALLDVAEAHYAADGLTQGRLSISAGALDGLERVLRTHLRPGDPIGLEDPGFLAGAALVRSLGYQPVPIEIDQHGPRPSAVEKALAQRIRALVITPRAQNPTGAYLDLTRAETLRTLVSSHPNVLVVEDDHAALITPVPVQSIAHGHSGPWAILRSVGKSLGPDLRLGFVLGDHSTIARVEGHLALGTRWVSHLLQHLVTELWTDSTVQQLIRTATRTYEHRRSALLEALQQRGIDAHGPSGLNVWLPTHRETRTVQLLADTGWIVAPGEGFRIDAAPGLRITTSQLDPDHAERLAADIAAVLNPGHRGSPT